MGSNREGGRPGPRHRNREAKNWLLYAALHAFLEEAAPLYRGAVFDLGCGDAVYRDFFLRYADSYVGIDWPNTLHGTGADIVADLNRPLPLQDEVADTVVSISVLEHLNEPRRMIAEAFRILRPGGGLVLQVPFQWHVHEAPHDYFRYTRHGLHYLLAGAGFSGIEVQAMTGFWGTSALKLNYQLVRLVRGPRPLRWAVGGALRPFFLLDQALGRALDRVWPAEDETAGYTVTATKPPRTVEMSEGAPRMSAVPA